MMPMTTVSLFLSLTLLPMVLLAAFIVLEGGLFQPQPSRSRHRRVDRLTHR